MEVGFISRIVKVRTTNYRRYSNWREIFTNPLIHVIPGWRGVEVFISSVG